MTSEKKWANPVDLSSIEATFNFNAVSSMNMWVGFVELRFWKYILDFNKIFWYGELFLNPHFCHEIVKLLLM